MKVKDIVKKIAESTNYQKLVKLVEDCATSVAVPSGKEIRDTLIAIDGELADKAQEIAKEISACCKSKLYPDRYNKEVLERAEEIKVSFKRNIEKYLPIYWRFLEEFRIRKEKVSSVDSQVVGQTV